MLTNKMASNTGTVLAVPLNENQNGTDLKQITYTNNDNYRDEWRILSCVSSVRLEAQQQSEWCWVACARMLSMKYMDSYISQASAAVFIKQGVETLFPSHRQPILNPSITHNRRCLPTDKDLKYFYIPTPFSVEIHSPIMC